jgi:hypothetical protein
MVGIIGPVIEKYMPQTCSQHGSYHGINKKGVELLNGLLFIEEYSFHNIPTQCKGYDP